jgi:hypothetical protein
MPRRDKTPPSLPIRVSHEATRTSTAQFAAAFECLVPVLERWVGPRPEADRSSKAASATQARQHMRR